MSDDETKILKKQIAADRALVVQVLHDELTAEDYPNSRRLRNALRRAYDAGAAEAQARALEVLRRMLREVRHDRFADLDGAVCAALFNAKREIEEGES